MDIDGKVEMTEDLNVVSLISICNKFCGHDVLHSGIIPGSSRKSDILKKG